MKKKIFFLVLCATVANATFAQKDNYNLEKYWRYKERFLNEFIVLPQGNSTSEGLSFPAMTIRLDDAGNKTFVDFSDGNANMSHYLGVLATEYRLLKNNGDNYDQIIKELYYATLALDRIDEHSESFFRADHSVQSGDKNGWMIRDDVTPKFIKENSVKFGIPCDDEKVCEDKFFSGYSHHDGGYDLESYSQDMVFHLLEGLALVSKLVDVEYVDIANRQVDFALWAKGTTTRIIRMMQHTAPIYLIHKDGNFNCAFPKPTWYEALVNPASEIVYKLGCEELQSKWYIMNPVTNQLAKEGNGDQFDTWALFSYGLVRAGNKITGVDYDFDGSSDNMQRQLFTSFFNANNTPELNALETVIIDAVTQAVGIPITLLPPEIRGAIVNQASSLAMASNDNLEKVKQLGAIGNIFGGDTFWKLRDSEFVQNKRYFHLMLMNMILHGGADAYASSAVYGSDKQYFSDLLFKAPCNGPRTLGTLSTDDYNVEWSASSRLLWSEENGITTDQDGNVYNWKFSGLDYMLLHNLYCLVYGSHFQKLSTKTTDDVVGKTKNEKAVEIIASNKISGGSTVTYTASKTVKLTSGFWVSNDSEFSAKTSSNTEYNAFSQYNPCIPHVSTGRMANSTEATDSDLSGINEASQGYLTVVPNPNNGTFNVILKTTIVEGDIKQIIISDITGQVVFRDEFEGKSLNVSLPNLKSRGLFIVSVICKEKTYQGKLIIE